MTEMKRTLPPCPENLAFCFSWMEDVAVLLSRPPLPFRFRPIALEDAVFLSDDRRILIPEDLALYYAHCTPWGEDIANPWAYWRAIRERLRHLFDSDAAVLPLTLLDADRVVVAIIIDETHYQLAEVREGVVQRWDAGLRAYLIERVLGET